MSVDSTTGPALTAELDQFVGRLGSALGEQWAPAARKWVARAPGRIDVMGGFAEYTGSLVLSYPLARGVLVAVAPRDDQQVVICALTHEGNGAATQCSWPLAQFYQPAGTLADPGTVTQQLADRPCDGAGDIAAALYALLQRQTIPHLGGGLTVGMGSALSGVVGAGAAAANSVATILAINQWLDLNLDAMTCAELACHGQNLLWNRAQDVADAVAVTFAQPERVLQLNCQTRQVIGSLPLPQGATLTAIDCGARSPSAHQKYIDARVAALMGRNLIARVLALEPARAPAWDGALSKLTIQDYVEGLRDRLPTKIKGRDFIDRFGQTGDHLTRIDPDKIYKVRSRAEHHIYENARAHQFAERLARAGRTQDPQTILEAGELMYASHWSYGQRCGLGSIETDRLVTLLRRIHPDLGVYGARISARGAGGTVVVLHRDTDDTRDAIRGAAEEYARNTDYQPDILTGSSLGAHAWGVHEII
ncbi:MAG TPA: galactokinase family protein [Phycisphaerae bacterium]|nr:galactokinase family protein [Phycisphaerae bacterium]